MSAILNFPRGHNSQNASLEELLAEDTDQLGARSQELMSAAARTVVDDQGSAARATTLAKLLGDQLKSLEESRKNRKEPFLEGCRTIDAHYNGLAAPLKGARENIIGMINLFQQQREEEAAAERRRLMARALEQQAAAEQEHAKALATGSTELEISARAHADLALTLVDKAETLATGPIDTGLGIKAYARRALVMEIVDLKAAILHLAESDPEQLREPVLKIYSRLLRAGSRNLPGARIGETTSTIVR